MAVEQEDQVIVGVNRFQSEDDSFSDPPSIDPEVEVKQVERLRQFKNNRDEDLVQKALCRLSDASISDSNLMPHIIKAVKDYATLGEICNTLRNTFGEYEREERF